MLLHLSSSFNISCLSLIADNIIYYLLLKNFVKARRALQALRGVVRLKRLLDGNAVKSQTMNALHCMQTMGRVQTQIHARRARMAEENRALQRHLQRKHEKELEKVKVSPHFMSLSAI